MTITETVSSNLKRIRTELHIPQEEAAFRCEISPRHYNSIENGRTNMSISTLDKLSRGLNVELSELVGIHKTEHTLIFTCIETEITDEDFDTVKTYGIEIEITQNINGESKATIVTCEDISTDRLKVNKLVSLLNKLQPSIAHVGDVVEDFLVEFEV